MLSCTCRKKVTDMLSVVLASRVSVVLDANERIRACVLQRKSRIDPVKLLLEMDAGFALKG